MNIAWTVASPITAFCPLRRIVPLISAFKAEIIPCGAENKGQIRRINCGD
jgi:hypothetical protein